MADLERLRELMCRLRDREHGCPWDLEQTFETIAPYTVEEAYEVEDAIRRSAWSELCGELGDLLLQVVYHARLAEEAGHFRLDDVVEAISAKLIRRHPHVFADAPRPHVTAATDLWESLKAQERAARGDTSAFDDVPRALPALLRAAKLERRARRVGLQARSGVEALVALSANPESLDAGGLGELLSGLAREAARRGFDPEALARESNARFEADLRRAERERRAAGAQRGVGGDPPVSSSPAPSDRDPEPDRSLAHDSSDVG